MMKAQDNWQRAALGELEQAWLARERSGELSRLDAIRVFYGPGDSAGELSGIAIDRFVERSGGATQAHAWVTEWEGAPGRGAVELRPVLTEFLKTKGFASAVALWRPDPGKGIPDEPEIIFGEPPRGRFAVSENELSFWVELQGVRHPGLFLDHEPLRRWLRARAKGWNVLNLFAYTGSLSVACGVGGAESVTTLDLSRPTVQWAEENWKLNSLEAARGDFIFGDVFEWLPKFSRKAKRFDCVLLDPPSFSRDKKGGRFSTSKDLGRLHDAVFSVLAPGGVVITSINSANVPVEKYEAELAQEARRAGRKFSVLHRFDLPETFPTPLGDSNQQRYLKGFILKELLGT
jgi:23S rRNA (cytosine1962-C5)-methyltransferase